MPRVGVVLPTRDRPATLGRAVASVLAQSFRDLELLVVDDGSTVPAEHTLAAVRDPRLRVLRTSVALGPARARNLALGALDAPWIAFQDDDDEWLPGKLAAQDERAREAAAHIGLIYGRFSRVREGGRSRPGGRSVARRRGDLLPELLRGNFIALPTVLVRAAALAEVGPFDAELPCFEDWELFLRLAERFELDFVDVDVLRAHESPASVNRAPSSIQVLAFERILDKHRPRIEREPRAHAWFLTRIGHHLCLAGRASEGRTNLLRSLREAPSLSTAATLAATALGGAAYRALARARQAVR